MPDLATQLRDYLDATAPPLETDEIIGDEVWIPADREPRQERRLLPGWAYGLAAMVVILVLTFGLVLLLPGEEEDEVVDEPTPTTVLTQPPTTAQTEPATDLNSASGTLDTLLGPISWVHAADTGLLPRWSDVIETPGGFAGVAEEEVSDGRYMSAWTTSSDGVTWTEADFPVPLDPGAQVHVDETSGVYWLIGGTRLWISGDAAAWTEVDLSVITPPSSTGVVWNSRLDSPAVSENLVLFPLVQQPDLPLQEIFDPGSEFTGGIHRSNCGWDWELEACQDAAEDVHVVFGVDANTGAETLLGRFRLEPGDERAYVVDIDAGARVHEFSIAGFSGEQLTGIPNSDLHRSEAVLLGPERGATVIEAPWSSFGLRAVFVASLGDRFLAYVDNGPPHGATSLDAIEVWESNDGIAWTSRGTADFGIDAPGEVDLTMVQRNDELIARITHDLDRNLPSATRLVSTDGMSWEPFAPDAPGSWVERTDIGLVAIGEGVFLSANGNRWEELISFDPGRGDAALIVDDTLIVALMGDGAQEVWAFDLEP